MKRKEVLTTGEVAKICHVAPRTVSKWFDSGKLRGYRIPGSRDRRIPLAQLVQFMRDHGMPMEGVEGNVTRVLIMDSDADAAAAVAESLSRDGRYDVHVAANDFEAGMRAEQFQPHAVLLDVMGDQKDAAEILSNLRSNTSLAATRVVAVAGPLTAGQRQSLLRNGFDAVISKPYKLDELRRVIEEATNLVS
jgi:excisionase family DNA binding protein